MNTPVNIELAKLLKEKGCELNHEYMVFTSVETEKYPEGELFLKPTIDEVKWWLYEKHGIWIWVEINGIDKTFDYHIHNLNTLGSSSNIEGYHFYSPTEAYEAAIKYTLKNLINERI